MTTPPPGPAPQIQLPPLRKGISYAFSDYDTQGKPQWMIHDAGRNKFFIIGWLEYEILCRWDLRDPFLIMESIRHETTLHVELGDIEQFLKFLVQHYLVIQTSKQINQQAKDQNLFKTDNILHWLVTYYLYFRIPLYHPDKFLERSIGVAKIIFSKTLALIMLALAVIAIYQLNQRWDEFTHTFSSIFSWKGLVLYMFVFLFCKLCHELGHAYMCKSYGVPVPTLGVAFLVFWPVLYTDTTLSWKLDSKKRLDIALAGMWVETYVTIIAALIWCNVNDPTLSAICYLVITVNWMASILINVSPFMRFDGYYVLADYLRMPNLQPRAFALTRWQIRKWLFGWDDPPPEIFTSRMHYFLVGYSIVTWLYRFILYIGIAVLVYHFFIKILGIILFAIEVFYFILGPILSEVKVWFYYKEKFTINKRTTITALIVFILLLIFFLPINESIKLPATLSYEHQFLIAPLDGYIDGKLPAVGSMVKVNQPIIKIRSPNLDNEIINLQLEYEKTLNQLRRAAIDPDYSSEKGVLFSDINKQISEYGKLVGIRKKLTLTARFDGKVVEVASNVDPGTFVKKNEWLGDIINPNNVQVEAFVQQIDVNRLKVGIEGRFYPQDTTFSVIPVTVVAIEVLNASELGCQFSKDISNNKEENFAVETPCYNSNEFGGDIATYVTDKGAFVPTESIYRVILKTSKPTDINFIERGNVVLSTSPSSFAFRVFYRVKSIWIEQSSF